MVYGTYNYSYGYGLWCLWSPYGYGLWCISVIMFMVYGLWFIYDMVYRRKFWSQTSDNMVMVMVYDVYDPHMDMVYDV